MRNKNRIALNLATSLFSLILLVWPPIDSGLSMASPALSDPVPAPPPLITTAKPVRHTFTQNLSWVGTVESMNSVDLTALVAGRVVAINSEDQALVSKGQLILKLGGPQIVEARTGLEAEIESLGSQIKLASQTVERRKQTLEAKLTTKDQLAEAQETKIKLENRLREARLRLRTLEQQEIISSPMAGVFTNRRVSIGQDVTPGEILGQIIDPAQLRISASLFPMPGTDLLGKQAVIHLTGEKSLHGIVRNVLPQTARTGATIIWLEGPQIDSQLRPGQLVDGNITIETRPALAVPESAIVYDSQENTLLFVLHGKDYTPLAVKLGHVQDGLAEVLSGLAPDQTVVTQGAYELYYRQFDKQFKVQD